MGRLCHSDSTVWMFQLSRLTCPSHPSRLTQLTHISQLFDFTYHSRLSQLTHLPQLFDIINHSCLSQLTHLPQFPKLTHPSQLSRLTLSSQLFHFTHSPSPRVCRGYLRWGGAQIRIGGSFLDSLEIIYCFGIHKIVNVCVCNWSISM